MGIPYLFQARGSDSVKMSLYSLEIFRVFRTQQLKSCLKSMKFVRCLLGVLFDIYCKVQPNISLTLALRPKDNSLPSRLLMSSGTASVTMETNSSSLP